jgi:crotonobetainyl-CoA:carnitine CoA-transferase CaiB-like acyl-CoA transferase
MHPNAQPAASQEEGPVSPLKGVRIVDAATLIAGPLAASILGEFGADVVKVEPPEGDSVRRWPPFRDGVSLPWLSLARNKRSVTLDLHEGQDRDALRDLLRESDVFITNFRLGTLEKWGLDYEDIRAVNPNLIMLHITGFGRTGPYQNRPAFGRVAEAFAGLTFITGQEGSAPVFPGYPLGDAVYGVYGALSVMLALRGRELAGRGGLIDMALYEPMFRILEDLAPGFLGASFVKQRRGNKQNHSVPNDIYPTADGEHVVLPASTANMWRRLVELIQEPDLEQYDTLEARVEHRDVIDRKIRAFSSQHSASDFLAMLVEHGIAGGRINSARDLATDEQVAARENVVWVPTSDGSSRVPVNAPVPRSDLIAGEVRWAGSAPGPVQDEET